MLSTEIQGVSTQTSQIPSLARRFRYAGCQIDARLFQVSAICSETRFNMTCFPSHTPHFVKVGTMAPLPLPLFNPGSSQALWKRIPIASCVGNSVKWHYGDAKQLGSSGIFDWSTVKSKRADPSHIKKRDDETSFDPEPGNAGNGGDSRDLLDTEQLSYIDRALESLQIADETPEGLVWDIAAPLSPIAEEGKPLSPIPEEGKPLSPIAEEDKPLSSIAEED